MKEKTIDKQAALILNKASEEGIETAWDRYERQLPQCGYGQLGLCCTLCALGPCRIDPFGEGPSRGVCGADRNTMVARNLLQMLASGAAAHSDHGREVLEVALSTAMEKAQGYKITDSEKLRRIAQEYGIQTNDKEDKEILKELSLAMMEEFGTIKGNIQFVKRAPAKRQEIWHNLDVIPRGIDREIVEAMHRVHMGVDNHYISILLHGIRTAIADGWGGSMIATEMSDILFGTPSLKESEVGLSTLREDQVNIVLHGHNPVLSEQIVVAAQDKELLDMAKEKGAKGINIVGMCCTGNEILMRQGIPIAGNMLNQELAIITGAVEAVVVDYQCIFPAILEVAKCFHTKIITTSEKAKFAGAIHCEFHPEKALETAKEIIKIAIENYPNRKRERVIIPDSSSKLMAGFSVETILSALGGSLSPIVDAIKQGKIKGAVGIVGCNNPKIKHDYGHVVLAKELIKKDVLVVVTGCSAIACAKAGLLMPDALSLAGDGLKEVLGSLGVPPVLHMGSCVDCSRILVLLSSIAKEIGVDISDLPVAGAAPEWYSQKAVSIGTYFVASGVFTVLGIAPRIFGSKKVTELLGDKLQEVIKAKFAIEPDPVKAAELIMDHINKKRSSLGI
ncbi:MAG: carbon-monoxide dehydrogenase catalytic subunit [Deltaproteobacteria bacterium]|nr:MAG: carbon-monoxide dehydrogenase catalytic subunit [Deltaproteobacteria bacterium]